ncbi:uncharacterized protein LOC135348159 [Halichondria panicea]|uniref:uncharacterized protein LOC135348159 n=1 Tax=Halichondria panicea TaxID=6063 RepID=UPI00312B465E
MSVYQRGSQLQKTTATSDTGVCQFTSEELSRLCLRHNAHVAYRGKVYNVSSFVAQHPGGMDQILMGAGRDITQVFDSYHQHDTAAKNLDKYYVGELVDNKLPVFPKEGKFYSTIKKRVADYMEAHKLDPKINYWTFLRHTILFVSVFSSWYAAVSMEYGVLMHLLFTMLWGVLSALVGLTCYHDASHFTITHKPWVWKVVMTISESVNGTSSYCWWYQHVFGHHLYTNINKADPDIYTRPDKPPSIWRIKSAQKLIGHYAYQHMYMPFVYTMLGVKMRLQDFHTICVLRKSFIRMNPLSVSQWTTFGVGKAVHVAMRFIIPCFYMTFGKLVVMNILYDMVYGYWLAQLTQVNHVTEEVEWPEPDTNNVIHQEWAEMQVRTTRDYCTDSWVWYFLSGGLNHQTAHHLFPGILQSNYWWITPIVKETCAEFGIQYNGSSSFKDALSRHFSYLRKMGKEGPEME